MDEFGSVPLDFAGTFITLEFGRGGRIQQMWVAGTSPAESEEFQFVCPPITMGDEKSEDYFPGTILLGARTNPDEPWVVSRNSTAEPLEEEDGQVFEYTFPFFEDLRATGRFHEIAGTPPQMAWDLTLRNESNRSIEIGELGFPFALNNYCGGFDFTLQGADAMLANRVHIDKYVGFDLSYLYAQRMNGLPPGLFILPGEGTQWEFTTQVRASVKSRSNWAGVPVVYVHSRAVMDRENWPDWYDRHSSLVLEPGEEKVYQTLFVPSDRAHLDGVQGDLARLQHGGMTVFPAAAAPIGMPIEILLEGFRPTEFHSIPPLKHEADSADTGGAVIYEPQQPGPFAVTAKDADGRVGEAQLWALPPIRDLVLSRARWMCEHQSFRGEDEVVHGAILPVNLETMLPFVPRANPLVIEWSLADGWFLAEKNALYPNLEEIETLNRHVGFVERVIRNPADGRVNVLLSHADAVAYDSRSERAYAPVVGMYEALSRMADWVPNGRPAHEWARLAGETALSFLELFGDSTALHPYMSVIWSAQQRCATFGIEIADALLNRLKRRDAWLRELGWPAATRPIVTNAGASESMESALRAGATEDALRVARMTVGHRSLAPSWWLYGTDVTNGDEIEATSAEVAFAPWTVDNSAWVYDVLRSPNSQLTESLFRQTLGSMVMAWVPVHEEGFALGPRSMDPGTSRSHLGAVTGAVSANLAMYLRRSEVVVFLRDGGAMAMNGVVGGNMEHPVLLVEPADGVGQRVSIPAYDVDVMAERGRIELVGTRFDRREIQVTLWNPAPVATQATIRLRGLWGKTAICGKEKAVSERGWFRFTPALGANERHTFRLQVLE